MWRRPWSSVVLLVVVACGTGGPGSATGEAVLHRPDGPQTVRRVRAALAPHAGARVRSWFREASVTFPPDRLDLVVLKEERRVELWATTGDVVHHVHDWPIHAASGTTGPKTREGDLQVPEGLYRIAWLNPNSRFHLSLKVDYPNRFDRRMARRESRTGLGGDIFVHGGAASIGCVALGDPAIEELFWLVAAAGRSRVHVVMAPFDLRDPTRVWPVDARRPWTTQLYRDIADALSRLKLPSGG